MLKIGEIVGPHGLRGEVKIIPYTDSPQRFSQLSRVVLRKGKEHKELQIAGFREHKNTVLMEFKEILTRTAAEELRNWDLVIPYHQALPLPADHFYDHQLEGLAVYDIHDNSYLGTLAEVLHLPANAVYRVEKAGISMLIPALKSVVRRVDLENRQMHVAPQAGM